MNTSVHLPSCYCIKLRRIASVLTRLYDDALAPCQLTISQYSLLCHIRSLPGSSIRALSDAAGLDRSTLARNLRHLLKNGWVEDGRGRGTRDCQLRLTKAGRALLAKAQPLWENIQQQISTVIDGQALQLLDSLLGELTSL